MAQNNIGIITQARTGSTRLPSKVLLKIKDKSLLQYHYDRLQTSGFHIVIATTVKSDDDQIEVFCRERNMDFYRGSEDDVLSRYYEAAVKYNLDTIIRVTSDCPLIDGNLIRKAVEEYRMMGDRHLYYSNTLTRTFPRGFDFEIFSMTLLEEAYKNATLPADREHVTPYIWNNRSGHTAIIQFIYPIDTSAYRLTVDTKEDFELISRMIGEYNAETLSAADIIAILDKNSELVRINAHIEQKKV
jgi:spore coat polysaccharide biosynthesis protein SpsF